MKIILLGWNGAKNAGDDAMTLAILFRIEKIYDYVESVEIISRTKYATFEYLHEHKFPFKIIINKKKYLFYPTLIKSFLVRYYFPLEIALKKNDIIIGGGSIFHSHNENKIYLRLIKYSKLLRKWKISNVYSMGTSTGPFYNRKAESAFIKILKSIDSIEVRDKRSYDFCRRYISQDKKLILSRDLVLELSNYALKNIGNQFAVKNYITIVLRRGKVSQEQYDWLIELIDFTMTSFPDMKIRLISFCSLENENENDMIEIKKFLEKIPRYEDQCEIQLYEENLFHLFTWMYESKFIVASRLHGSIIAKMLNKPFLMLSYHTKCEDFFIDMGLDKQYLIKESFNQANFLKTLHSMNIDGLTSSHE